MSRPTPLSLPRFHVNALSPTLRGRAATIDLDVPAETFENVQTEAGVAEDPDNPVGAEPAVPQSILPEVDTGAILNHLEAALAGLERSALGHSQQLVSDFIQAAFPNLCQAFLAEEVTRAMSDLTPPSIEALVLRVPPAYERAFQHALHASSRLSEICDLQITASGDDILVDVDWVEGGLQFDMDKFLATSLDRLIGLQPTQEGQDV